MKRFLKWLFSEEWDKLRTDIRDREYRYYESISEHHCKITENDYIAMGLVKRHEFQQEVPGRRVCINCRVRKVGGDKGSSALDEYCRIDQIMDWLSQRAKRTSKSPNH